VSIGNRMINARAETVMEKPAYRSAFRERRCLIVADGFYEWKKEDRGKRPYFLRMRDDRPFAFAGLWETWKSPDNAAIESCVLLTTDPNSVVAAIHDRMPVILKPDDCDRWLDPDCHETDSLRSLFRPYAGEEMIAYPVGSYVNIPTHDDPRCVEPLAADGSSGRLFAT
jgi:putative SOS response-associated peptidase YedK